MVSFSKVIIIVFDNVYPAHPIFDESGDGILFHGYSLPIDKLGLSGCLNRPTKIYHIKNYCNREEVSFENLDFSEK